VTAVYVSAFSDLLEDLSQ